MSSGGPAASIKQIGRGRLTGVLTAALQRTTGRSPLLPEYPLHPRPRWGWTGDAPEALVDWLTTRENACLPAIERALALEPWCPSVPATPAAAGPGEPCWDNDFWGGLDAVVQVAELAHRNPRRYIEVGSGWSTRFARRAIAEFGLRTEITSIDPHPRAEVDALCDQVVRARVEDTDLALFATLEGGDVLLIDGSHTAFMNSDTTVLFAEVLPQLPPGVTVAIDDIFLPWDYPPTWEGRLYGEQYLLAMLLLGGAVGWNLVFAGFHLTRQSPLASRFEPLWPHVETRHGRLATSFWMERV